MKGCGFEGKAASWFLTGSWTSETLMVLKTLAAPCEQAVSLGSKTAVVQNRCVTSGLNSPVIYPAVIYSHIYPFWSSLLIRFGKCHSSVKTAAVTEHAAVHISRIFWRGAFCSPLDHQLYSQISHLFEKKRPTAWRKVLWFNETVRKQILSS